MHVLEPLCYPCAIRLNLRHLHDYYDPYFYKAKPQKDLELNLQMPFPKEHIQLFYKNMFLSFLSKDFVLFSVQC